MSATPTPVVLLKLRSGDEIIARRAESADADVLLLTHIRVLHLTQDRVDPTKPRVTMFPFLLGCTHPDIETPIRRKDVMIDLTANLNPGLERSYYEASSGIQLASH